MNLVPRRYSMERRSANAEATKARVHAVATALYAERPHDFALKTVAERAGTSVQTILRIYGSKAALLETLIEAGRTQTRRSMPLPATIEAAIRARYSEYERSGELGGPVASEARRDLSPGKQGESARQSHRAWVEEVFADFLGSQTSLADQARLFGLIAATDISAWKLLRRDYGLYRRAAEAVVIGIISALINER